MEKFDVWLAKDHRPVKNEHKIFFNARMVITPDDVEGTHIARHKFNFSQFDTLSSRVHDKTHLIGQFSLSSLSGTKVYIDLDTQAVIDYKNSQSTKESHSFVIYKIFPATMDVDDPLMKEIIDEVAGGGSVVVLASGSSVVSVCWWCWCLLLGVGGADVVLTDADVVIGIDSLLCYRCRCFLPMADADRPILNRR
ncbi:hypothetical protein IFM89_003686 [Coptis chinensis]|uniref:Uncharacterized protein n=1 Tax=Coptis chinensis TaxID=261450 RepID=A0A835IUI7_9MAGN|nr:hypothetical protein IFM89_003686 [Coptis chinensis]